MKRFMFFLVAALLSIQITSAQPVFNRVYDILQTNCASSCHNYGSPDGGLLLDGTRQDVLNNLVRVTPFNAHAALQGYERVKPGDARRSLLFRKVNHGLDTHISLHDDEGDPMPKDTLPLTEVERELIRQWIIFGAADTGYQYADEQTIIDYYGGFAEQRDPSLPVPDPSEGFQIYYGPIFLRPNDEIEFDSKFPLFNDIDLEVYRMEAAVNKESHHMAVFKYYPGKADLMADGLRLVRGIGEAADLFDKAEPIGQWPNSLDVETPFGTALMWDSATVLNMSYHILNYSDSIIACEVYLNIYYRPRQQGTIPMLSYPVRYDGKPVYEGGWEVGNLIIPPNHLGDSTRLTITQYGNPDSDMWHIWSIQAHTHELGKDYNVWHRNPDGSKGDHLYIGKSNATHTFQTGFYDWEHPPLRIFNPMYPVDMSVGLIHEAVFHNDRPDTAGFGLRTIDEMFVTYIFYAKSAPVGIIPGKTFNEAHVRIFPNPVSHEAFIQISPDMPLKNAELRIYDSIGKEVSVLKNITERQLSMNFSGLPRGNFFYRLISDGQSAASGKFVIAR